jgi:hypothetical protein
LDGPGQDIADTLLCLGCQAMAAIGVGLAQQVIALTVLGGGRSELEGCLGCAREKGRGARKNRRSKGASGQRKTSGLPGDAREVPRALHAVRGLERRPTRPRALGPRPPRG